MSGRLWIAQGFGSGRIPFAPGTFGSLVGLLWLALLLRAGNWLVLIGGAAVGVGLSVWLSGFGEQVLRQKDPSSVVLDEIAAMPICFFAWLGILTRQTGTLPEFGAVFAGKNTLIIIGIFLAFRLFDVAKPWPVRQSQSLPGGWGITIDDLLAALYVNVVSLIFYAAWIALKPK